MYDIAIIGAGPSGITAGIYAKRFNLNVIIFENNAPGGAIVNTETINNYPGVGKVSGAELAYSMFNQLMDLKVEYESSEVQNIKKENDYFVIKASDSEISTKTVIIATGTSNKQLGLPNEKMYLYKGISWCAICDGPLYKGKNVAVVGGGMSAISSALTLGKLGCNIYLIHRRNEFRGEKKDLELLYNSNNVTFFLESTITKLIGDKKLEKIEIDTKGQKRILDIECLFECVGKIPNTSFLSDLVLLDENKYIKVDSSMETNVKGIFACGDVVQKDVRQICTAVSDGAIAAISANKSIK